MLVGVDLLVEDPWLVKWTVTCEPLGNRTPADLPADFRLGLPLEAGIKALALAPACEQALNMSDCFPGWPALTHYSKSLSHQWHTSAPQTFFTPCTQGCAAAALLRCELMGAWYRGTTHMRISGDPRSSGSKPPALCQLKAPTGWGTLQKPDCNSRL